MRQHATLNATAVGAAFSATATAAEPASLAAAALAASTHASAALATPITTPEPATSQPASKPAAAVSAAAALSSTNATALTTSLATAKPAAAQSTSSVATRTGPRLRGRPSPLPRAVRVHVQHRLLWQFVGRAHAPNGQHRRQCAAVPRRVHCERRRLPLLVVARTRRPGASQLQQVL